MQRSVTLTSNILIRAFTFIVLLANAAMILSASAGEYKLIYEDKKSGYTIADTSGVCQAYEKNLNKFRHIPYGMACNRALDPALGFTRPKWKRLDPKKYSKLIREIYKVRKRKLDSLDDPVKWRSYLESRVDAGSLSLEVTKVNIGRDKGPVNFVRLGANAKCDDVKRFNSLLSLGIERIFGVSDDLEHLASFADLGYGKGNLILFKDRILTDHFYGAPVGAKINIGRDATLILNEVDSKRVGQLCSFYYYEK